MKMDKKAEDDAQAESDLRTLIEAAKISKDKKRMSAVLRKKKDLAASLKAITSTAQGDYLDE